MTERSFFDWRNALPGYTFILIILGINYAPLVEIFTNLGIQSTFGAILAFLTLVSGSAIGFLVSQLWWCHYRNQGAHYFYRKKPRKQINRLVEKYGLVPANDINDENGIQNVLTVYSFILFNQQQKDPELVKYLIRRGDTFHAFSATRISLLLGLAIGIFSRALSQLFVFRWTHTKPFANLMSAMPNSAVAEVLILILLVISAIFLIYLFGKSRDWTVTQYDKMAFALINKSGIRRWKLKEIFPSDYFDPNWKEE